jgi:myosin-crossreactive antigen
MDKNITIKGLDDFNEVEVEKIKSLVSTGYEKIKRDVKGTLVLHAKKHSKDGDRAIYSFHGKIKTPGNLINVEDSDWLLSTAIHKVMNKLKSSTQNKFRK